MTTSSSVRVEWITWGYYHDDIAEGEKASANPKKDAAAFIGKIGLKRLIDITETGRRVTVWYQK